MDSDLRERSSKLSEVSHLERTGAGTETDSIWLQNGSTSHVGLAWEWPGRCQALLGPIPTFHLLLPLPLSGSPLFPLHLSGTSTPRTQCGLPEREPGELLCTLEFRMVAEGRDIRRIHVAKRVESQLLPLSNECSDPYDSCEGRGLDGSLPALIQPSLR